MEDIAFKEHFEISSGGGGAGGPAHGAPGDQRGPVPCGGQVGPQRLLPLLPGPQQLGDQHRDHRSGLLDGLPAPARKPHLHRQVRPVISTTSAGAGAGAGAHHGLYGELGGHSENMKT